MGLREWLGRIFFESISLSDFVALKILAKKPQGHYVAEKRKLCEPLCLCALVAKNT